MSDDFFDNVVQRRDLDEVENPFRMENTDLPGEPVNLSDRQSQVSDDSNSVMSFLSLLSDQDAYSDENEQPRTGRANIDIDLMDRYLQDARTGMISYHVAKV